MRMKTIDACACIGKWKIVGKTYKRGWGLFIRLIFQGFIDTSDKYEVQRSDACSVFVGHVESKFYLRKQESKNRKWKLDISCKWHGPV